MTITQIPTAPLVAVVGATGTQGGSIVKALTESDHPYRVRAFTRDATKPAAQELLKLGVDVVVVNLVLENKDAVYKAFAGGDIAFLVTNFWAHLDMDRVLVDAANAGGVSRIVWSGLPSISELSAGKYKHVYHFDAKAAVTAYIRQLGVPFVDVQAGFYGTNFLSNPIMLMKQDDGSVAIPWPAKPTTKVPVLDTAHDYGLFVRHALELPVFPDGSEVVAHGEMISIKDMAFQLSQATGKTIVFKQISVEQFKVNVQTLGVPPHILLDMADWFQWYDEFGWKATTNHGGLARPPRTWVEFVRATDWSEAVA
ncbi:NAD(P)-binding protein [Mycena vulgaris]|nr:NAD(P)-binding protein [Mycena vulgaris]